MGYDVFHRVQEPEPPQKHSVILPPIKKLVVYTEGEEEALTQFGQLPNFQHVLVELVIVGDREDNLIESLQLLDVVLGDVP